MSKFLEVPQIKQLITTEISKILIAGQQPNAKLITGEQDGLILEYMALEYYFNEVTNKLPENYKKVTKDFMYELWPTRFDKKRTPDDLLTLLHTKCIQEILKTQISTLFQAEKRNEESLKSDGLTGDQLQKERILLIKQNIGYFALTFVNGVDKIFTKEYYIDKDGNLIGTKHERERNTTGKNCGIPYYPDGTEQTPAVAPPPNAVEVVEGETPLLLAPIPPIRQLGGRKTRRKGKKRKTRSRKFKR